MFSGTLTRIFFSGVICARNKIYLVERIPVTMKIHSCFTTLNDSKQVIVCLIENHNWICLRERLIIRSLPVFAHNDYTNLIIIILRALNDIPQAC